ncbi:unnamed protein product [Pedinophyceae sp. YPF-701]|nr:unnamed protein product [Pedinophyceae sp. YPF-701]
MANAMMGAWSTGLCGCFEDCPSLCYACTCSPCLYADVMDRLNGSGHFGNFCIFCLMQGFFPLCLPCVTQTSRSTLRAKYQLPPAPCGDCCTHFWCLYCALCQEYRELKNRGVASYKAPGQPITQAPMQM